MYLCLILNDWEMMNNFFIWVIKGLWKFIWIKLNIVFFFILWVFLLFIIKEKCVRVKNFFYNDNDYNNVKYVLLLEKKYNFIWFEKKFKFKFYWM